MNACTFTDKSGDRFLAGVLIEAEMRRGASRQELIDLAVRYEKWGFVRALQASKGFPPTFRVFS